MCRECVTFVHIVRGFPVLTESYKHFPISLPSIILRVWWEFIYRHTHKVSSWTQHGRYTESDEEPGCDRMKSIAAESIALRTSKDISSASIEATKTPTTSEGVILWYRWKLICARKYCCRSDEAHLSKACAQRSNHFFVDAAEALGASLHDQHRTRCQ